jgi:hypothetical protein
MQCLQRPVRSLATAQQRVRAAARPRTVSVHAAAPKDVLLRRRVVGRGGPQAGGGAVDGARAPDWSQWAPPTRGRGAGAAGPPPCAAAARRAPVAHGARCTAAPTAPGRRPPPQPPACPPLARPPRSLSQLGEIAVLAVDGTGVVAEAARRHGTAPTATAALGRTLMGALLMGSFRKDDEAIQARPGWSRGWGAWAAGGFMAPPHSCACAGGRAGSGLPRVERRSPPARPPPPRPPRSASRATAASAACLQSQTPRCSATRAAGGADAQRGVRSRRGAQACGARAAVLTARPCLLLTSPFAPPSPLAAAGQCQGAGGQPQVGPAAADGRQAGGRRRGRLG